MTHFQATFFLRAIIDTAGNDVPSTVHISEVPTPYRTGPRQRQLSFMISVLDLLSISETYQDRTNRNQTIVQAPGVRNIACLESQLKAATSHSKAHRVKINVIREGCTILRICGPTCLSKTVTCRAIQTRIFLVNVAVPGNRWVDKWTRGLLVEKNW